MYFPNDNTKLESLPRESFVSLGEDPSFLLLAKNHCSLPAAPEWTEMDANLKMLIDAAEDFIDSLAKLPYRPRSYVLNLSGTCQDAGSLSTAIAVSGRRFSAVRLPKAPVTVDDIVVSILSDDDEAYTVLTGWKLVAGYSLAPEIVFNRDFVFPTVTQAYPVKIAFTTVADKENVIQKMAILCLTNFFFKNPEAIVAKELTGIPGLFWDCLNRLGVGGYA